MALYRLGILSDTHGSLHPRLFELFDGVDVILHAGDVVGDGVLDELGVLAPVHAVAGNCDYPGPRLPVQQRLELPCGRVGICHSHLVHGRAGDPGPLVASFGDFDPVLVVYGHTHRQALVRHGATWVLNPGAAGRPRFDDKPSVVLAGWDHDSGQFTLEVVALDWRGVAGRGAAH